MEHIGRLASVVIFVCASLAGQSARDSSNRYREALDRCRFLVNESRTREAEHACREAVKLAGQLPASATRERVAANSLAAQVYLDLGLPEDALTFAKPASQLAEASLTTVDVLRGTVRYQLARCYEGLGTLREAEQAYRTAVVDLEAAARHAKDASQRKAAATPLKNALQSYRQLLSAEGKNDEAAAVGKQLGAAGKPAPKR